MTDSLILHHYQASPFSEKARLMLGYKRLDWASVIVPVIMPKPDVVALTGGYRKTPFLQVGADIYCDTTLIAQVLEQRATEPTLYPASAPLAPLLAQWADSQLFWTAIPYTMQPAGLAHVFAGLAPEAVKAFMADRAPFTAGMRHLTVADATVQLRHHLAALQAQLARGGPWLFGAEASIADFAVAHCLWYVNRVPPLATIFERHADVADWLERVLAIGHGQSRPMTSAQAIDVAAGAAHHAATRVDADLGFEPGTAVTVSAVDYGVDPVQGMLVGLTGDEVVVRRTDERAGVVHVHFPRHGFQIRKDKR